MAHYNDIEKQLSTKSN